VLRRRQPTVYGNAVTVRQVSETSAILHLDASGNKTALEFLPGQYARVLVPGTDAWRSYSFANRPNPTNELQFLIRLLPDGAMSNYIRERCQPGQAVQFEAPLGAFYLRQIERPLIMVAGGTGLSAFLGMLDDHANQGTCTQLIRLYYGVTNLRDLCELDRLEAYARRLPDFQCETVVMNPDPAWQGKTGLIPAHFDRALFEARPCDMYLCGPPPMVEAVKRWLGEQGLDHVRLYYEKFADSGAKAV
jgi:anthranilate 1,2-dioxygenase reductase subunit